MACRCQPWKQTGLDSWERRCLTWAGRPALLRARAAGRIFQAKIELPDAQAEVYPQGVAHSVEEAKSLAESELDRRFCRPRMSGGWGRLRRRVR
jgi:hypothetical protein